MTNKNQTGSPEIPVTGIKKFGQVVGGLMIMAAILYGIGGGLIWLFTPSAPTTIKEISSHIISANEVTKDGKKLLKIELNEKGYSDYSYFFSASEEIKNILAKMTEYFPNQSAEQIDFVLNAELSDQYGNTSSLPVINLPFAMSEIKKINFKNDNFTNWDLLKLAEPVIFIHPAGQKIITAYCQDADTIKYTGMFCPVSLYNAK
jgi:hypothetical protein